MGRLNRFIFAIILCIFVFAGYSAAAEDDGPLLQEYCYSCNVYNVKPYTPYGFTGEIAYAGPSLLSVHLLGYRNFYIKHKVLIGLPGLSADFDFEDGGITDEGILAALLFLGSIGPNGGPGIWLSYILFGNTYYPLTENDQFGLFESHHIVDYAIYDVSCGKPWEFGFTEAAGIRLVYAKGSRDGTYYLDLGGNVRWTNRSFRFGVFLQWGFTGTHT